LGHTAYARTAFFADLSLPGRRPGAVRSRGRDPYLISEELARLAPQLVAAVGEEPLTGIVLDASYYTSDLLCVPKTYTRT
jgi:hypothetical protein